MTPLKWLNIKAPGFSDLSLKERSAIMQFAFLWSFFETTALNTQASATSIRALVSAWQESGRLTSRPFQRSLSYFQHRYFQNGQPTEFFCGLKLRRNDSPELIEAVLKSENNLQVDSVAAVLIVVYRLRNNLFHGAKWAYGIRGQLANFTHANIALVAALDMVERTRR